MSTTTFTKVDPISKNEKDWAYELGLLDWDSTKIVFTKRQLIEFLGYAGVTVDPNFVNIQKLPRYAEFGKMSGEATPAVSVASVPQTSMMSDSMSSDVFKPTRRVREAPGGRSSNIFGDPDVPDDEFNAQFNGSRNVAAPPPALPETKETPAEPAQESTSQPTAASDPPPPRRKENKGTLSTNMFESGETGLQTEKFKPTRRVREAPGGDNNMWGIL